MKKSIITTHSYSFNKKFAYLEEKRLNESFEDEIINKFRVKKEEIGINKLRPRYFDTIREYFGITEDNILESLNLDSNRANIFKTGEGEGKSGSFFFFSFDKKYIIKTISSDEVKIFLKFLGNYSQHITQNLGSIIAVILGVYTLKIKGLFPVHIILMINSLPILEGYVIYYY